MTFHVPNKFRIRAGRYGSDESYGNNGAFDVRLKHNQMVHFMKNLAIVGGLLHIMVMGPGRVSMDASRARKHADDSHD